MRKVLRLFVSCVLFLSAGYALHAEGTKELMPDSLNSTNCEILIANGNVGGNQRDPFALYNGDTNYRLFIHISDYTREKIYFGIGSSSGGVVNWRIHRPNGGIEWTGTTPTSGPGFITYYSQAYAGPTKLDPHGYNANVLTPTANGDYFMTFQVGASQSRAYTKFDITVIDTVTNQPMNGRVFSKAWQLNTNTPAAHGFFGKLFVYSNDGIVSRFDPNGFDGRWFTVSCNESGCYPISPTHNAQQARQSTLGWHNYPQYKIFLNNPDTLVYPSGVIGQLVPGSVTTETYCNSGTIDFYFATTSVGTVEVLLDLSTLGPPYVDRILVETVTGGLDTISWDGLDGNGVPIVNGATFPFSLSYTNGLTHLPLWDVEGNPNGFKVNLTRPITVPPTPDPSFFWDDSQVGGATLITPPGCNSSPTSGCHDWPGDWGDNKTINTWWYVTSTSTVPVTIQYKVGPKPLGVVSGADFVCPGMNYSYTVTGDPNSEQYRWIYPGGVDTTALPTISITIPLGATPGPAQVTVHGINTVCGDGPVSVKDITIRPLPNTNPPFTKSICSGTSTNIPLTSTPPGAVFTWTFPAPTCSGNIFVCPGGMINSTLINDVLGVTDMNPGTVEYHLTPLLNGCQGPVQNIMVTVNPLPDVSNGLLNFSLCNGGTTNIPLTSSIPATTFSWTAIPSSPNLSGYSNSSGSTVSQQLFNSGSTVETVTYQVTPSVNGCNGPVKNFVVTVQPVALLTNFPHSQEQCDNLSTNLTLLSNVAGAQFTWTCSPSSGSITGWSDNAIPTATLNQTLDNTGYGIEWVTYTITPVINGCAGTIVDYTVTVYPTPDLSNDPMSQQQCDSLATNISLTSNVATTLFTWTCDPSSANITGWADNGTGTTVLNQTLNNTGYNIEWVTYHVTPAANGCLGPDTSYTVTVFPTPDLSNLPASSAQCDNLTANIPLTSNVAGTLFTWTCIPSSANITGWTNNAVPTTILNQTLDNTGYNTEWVTYQIVPEANGCDGSLTNFVVTIYPTPDLSNTPDSSSQCDDLLTNVLLTSNVAGTQFTWTCTPSTANITGWSDNGIPTVMISQLLNNTGYNIEWVTYQVTPAANGCLGSSANYVVTVFPTPDLSNFPASSEQCDSLTTNITLTSNVAGTLFTWTCAPSTGNITGWTDNGIGTTVLNQTLVNTGYNIEWVTYQVTPSANGCAGPPAFYQVTVFPTPDLSNMPPAMQLCNNSFTNLTLTSNVAGALFTWTCSPSSANITGWSNNAVPTTLLNQFLTNLGLNTEWVTYSVTPSAYGCFGNATDYTVTVVQSPDVFFSPAAQTICSQSASNIQVLSSVPGTTFTWTATPSSPNLSGQAPGSGNLIAQTVTNSGNTIESVTYQVTPTAFGCPPGNTQNVVLTVNPTPAISNPITTFQMCSAATTNIVFTSTVPGSTYSWTASGSSPNVSGYLNGAGPSIVQTLTNTGFNIESATYQVVPTANGCPGNLTSFVVTVYPVADVVFTPNGQSFCSGLTSSVSLTSNVAGTSFTWTASGSGPSLSGFAPGSGNFIQQTLFNSGPYPENANYQVFPTAYGCPGTSNTVAVTVNPLPVVTVTPCFDPVVSVGSQAIPLRGNIPVGGTWSGPGVSAGSFVPALAGPGNHVLNYSYTNTWGCAAGTNVSITVTTLAPFTCGNTLTDVRDSKAYPTVLIGGQCWFAANLDYGATIPSGQMQRDNCVFEKYCFGDNPANCGTTGGLYQWDELMRYASNNGAQGFCPPEWHVPTEGDWNTLFSFYISNGFAGSSLKYTGYSGFNALLTGTRFNNVQWDFNNFAVLYWSSTFHTARKAWAHGMNTFNPSVSFYPSHRNNAFPVRCIRD